MKARKIVSAFLATFCINAQAFMSTPEVACSYGVLDCPTYLFGLDFRALFFQSHITNTSNKSYAFKAAPVSVSSTDCNISDSSPKTHFGFELGLGTLFLCNNTNFTVNWQHFSSCDTIHKQDLFVHHTTKFDEVTANWGQLFTFDCLQLNFTAGVCYTRIEQILWSRYTGASNTTFHHVAAPSKFTGAGPQLGLDLSYALFSNFCLVGKVATAILVGRLGPNLAKINSKQVIPALKDRLGISYYCNFFDSICVNIEAGYDAKIYLSAFQYNRNFALVGPYVSISSEF